MNTRRIIKHWLKAIQRGKLTYTALEQRFADLGISADIGDIKEFLRLNIRGAIISRLGRAAKKSGCFVSLREICFVAEVKKGKAHSEYLRSLGCKYQDYHKLKFYRLVRVPFAQLEIGEYIVQEGLLNGVKIEERTVQTCRGERFEVSPVAARQILDATPAYANRLAPKN